MHSPESGPRGDEAPDLKSKAERGQDLADAILRAEEKAAKMREMRDMETAAHKIDELNADQILADTEDVWRDDVDAMLKDSDAGWSEGTRDAVARGVLADLDDYQGPIEGTKTDQDYYQEGLNRELDDDSWLDELEGGVSAANLLANERKADAYAAKAAAAQARLDATLASGPEISDDDSFLDDGFFNAGGDQIAKVDADFGDGFDMDDDKPIQIQKSDEAIANKRIIDAPKKVLAKRAPRKTNIRGSHEGFLRMVRGGIKLNFKKGSLDFEDTDKFQIVSRDANLPIAFRETPGDGYQNIDLSEGGELNVMAEGDSDVKIIAKAGTRHIEYLLRRLDA